MSLCHLSWDSYKNNICNGFARLQQREEFVDMTLAAEGHLVQVHRSLVAVASPYIKEMLKIAPSQNPVVFLSGVSYDVLCYLLEYIYTGEVKVPIDRMKEFAEQAKALHIVGVDSIVAPLCPRQVINEDRQRPRHDMERMTNEDLQNTERSDFMIDSNEQNRPMSPSWEQNEISKIPRCDIERTANEDLQNQNLEQPAVMIQQNKPLRDFRRKGGTKLIRRAANAAQKLILKHSSDAIPTRRLRRRLDLRGKRTVNDDSNQKDLQNENCILSDFNIDQTEQKKSITGTNHVTGLHLEPQANNCIDTTNLAYNTEPNDQVDNPIDFEDEMLQKYIENVKNSATNINNEPKSSHSVVNFDLDHQVTLTDENNAVIIPIISTIADTTNVSNQGFQISNNTEAPISIDANEVDEMLNSDVNVKPEISSDFNVEFKILTENGQTKHSTIADTTNVSIQRFQTSNNIEAPISMDANEVNEMLNSDVNVRPKISSDFNIEFKILTEDGQTKHSTIADTTNVSNQDSQTSNNTETPIFMDANEINKLLNSHLNVRPEISADYNIGIKMLTEDGQTKYSTIADTTNVSNQDFQTSNNAEAHIFMDANEVNIMNSDVNVRPEISADYNIEFKMITEDGQTKHETITIKPLDQLSSIIPSESVIKAKETKDVSPYYMLSEKKRLIAIFNRYMYYEHHSSKNGMKRRWRCIQYRKLRCKAYMDTIGEVIENRKFEHTHPFHDTQIVKKADSKQPMFTTIADALASKTKSGGDDNND